jgi:hypothetical protein
MPEINGLKVCLLTTACQSICLSAKLSACNNSQTTSKDFDTILDCEFLQKFVNTKPNLVMSEGK